MRKYLILLFLILFTSGAAFGSGNPGDYVQVGDGYLGTAATRNAEDALTDGSNLPDGHAIKTYGDDNWGAGGGTGYWTLATDDIYYTDGKVAIGTTDFTGIHRLAYIHGTSTENLSKTLKVVHNAIALGTIYAGHFSSAGAGVSNVGIYASASGSTYDYAAIFEYGDVGIGTTTPDTELEVVGVITATDGTSTNWNTAYTDRLKWDGGSDSLVAATALTSLGLDGTASATTSGAYLVGVYDELEFSNADNVQDALSDLDYAISNPTTYSEVKTGRVRFNSTTGRAVTFVLPPMDDTDYNVLTTNWSQAVDAGEISIEDKTTTGFTLKNSGVNTTSYFEYMAIPYTLRGSTQQEGTDTFNSTTGVTVALAPNLDDTDYDVIISLPSQTLIEDIGAVSVESKAVNQFVVKNSGADTVTTFNWLAVPYALGGETDFSGTDDFASTTGVEVAIGGDVGSISYVVVITSASQTNLVDVGVVSIESKTQTTFDVVNSGSGTSEFEWRVFPQVAGAADMYRTVYDADIDGYINLEAGGFDADVSAYAGLLKISGGAASYITDSSTNWGTAYTHSQATTGAEHGAVTTNTANKIVRRGASGEFAAGVITASLTGNVTGNVTGDVVGDVTGDLTGIADTALLLENSRYIGGILFTGGANIVPATNYVIDESTDTSCYIAYFSAPGVDDLQLKTGTNLTFNSVTGVLTAAGFIADGGDFVGDLTGDVTGDVVGNVTGNVTGNASGTAGVGLKTRIADNESTNETNAVVFLPGGDLDGGDLALESDGTFNYNPSTGTVTSTVFAGNLTGNVTGNVTATTVTATTLTDGTASMSGGAITAVTSLTFTGANATPNASGELQYDSTITGLSGGGLRWYDDNSARLIVDLETDPSNDDYVVAYDAGNDFFYMKEDAEGEGTSYTAGSGIGLSDATFFVAAGVGLTAETDGLKVGVGLITFLELEDMSFDEGTADVEYTNTTITVDDDGRVKSIETGSSSGLTAGDGCDITADVITVAAGQGLSQSGTPGNSAGLEVSDTEFGEWNAAYDERHEWDGTAVTSASNGRLALGLSGHTDPADSGAYYLGVYNQFSHSTATNVQDVLDDLDAAIVGGSYLYLVNAASTDQGVDDDNNSVKDIIDGVGSTNKATLYFSHDPSSEFTDYTFSTAESIPDNFTLVFERGARLVLDSANVVIEGDINAGQFQIFTGSGTVTFGVGSIERYNVRWRGATGDGVTDDTTTIQAAIDDVESISNDWRVPIYFPNGHYLISAALTCEAHGMTLEGTPSSGSWIISNNSTANIIMLGNGADFMYRFMVRNLFLTKSVVSAAGYAIYANYISTLLIDNVEIYGDNKVFGGINFYRSWDGYITETVHIVSLISSGIVVMGTAGRNSGELRISALIHGNGGNGIVLNPYVEAVYLHGANLFGNADNGVLIQGGAGGVHNILIYDSVLDTSGLTGLYADNVDKLILNNNWIGENAYDGIKITENTSRVSITGGTVIQSHRNGIAIDGDDVIVSNVMVESSSKLTNNVYDSIYIGSASDGVSIHGNTIIDPVGNTRYGVQVHSSAANVVVENNRIETMQTDYMNVGSNVIVRNNVPNVGGGGGGTSLGWYVAGECGGGTDQQKIEECIEDAEDAGGGVVYIPPGTWTLTSTITISSDFVYLKGAGMRVTTLQRSANYGDTIRFRTGAVSNMFYGGVSDLSILQLTNRMTYGSHIDLQYTYFPVIKDVELYNGWIGITVRGKTNMVQIERVEIYCASPYTASNMAYAGINFVAGSYSDGACTARIVDTDISGAARLISYGIKIATADGLWFSNVHTHRSMYGLYISPSASAFLAGLKFDNCWFDSDLPSPHGNAGVYIGGTTSVYTLIDFNNCYFQGYYTGNGLMVAAGSNVTHLQVNNSTFYNYKYNAIQIYGGTFISIKGNHITGSSSSSVGVSDSILIGNGATGVNYFTIKNNSIGSTLAGGAGTARYGIVIQANCNNYTVSNNDIRLTTNNAGIYDGGLSSKRVFGNTTDTNPTGS